MKILINTASTHKGGGVQVAQSFIEECRNFKDHEYHVVLGEMLSKLVKTEKFPNNFSFYALGYRPATRIFSFRSHKKDLKEIEKKTNPDVVFTTSGPAYWRPNAPHLVGYNLPHYIYKDSPFFSQISNYRRFKWNLKGSILKSYFRSDADAYVVQTDDVNRRLREWLHLSDDKVYTVSNTVSSHYINPKKVNEKLPKREKEAFRFLTLSAWYKHKNLEVIPNVVSILPESVRQKVRFILTLPDEDFCTHFSKGVDGTILNIGPIKPEEGPALYKECDALFLPTLLECFSASYAEAMIMDKPIITSDLGFAHSVCGDAAHYVNPVNLNDIVEKIIELVENHQLQRDLIQKGREQLHTFANARERAEKYLEICKIIADAGKN